MVDLEDKQLAKERVDAKKAKLNKPVAKAHFNAP